MNKKIDIGKLEKRNPYIVPEDYFLALTPNIMDKVDTPEKRHIFSTFQLQTLAPTFAILLIVFSAVWYNNQNPNITNEDLVELLSFYQVEDELLLEYVELELEENIDEYLLNEFNYNELIYEL